VTVSARSSPQQVIERSPHPSIPNRISPTIGTLSFHTDWSPGPFQLTFKCGPAFRADDGKLSHCECHYQPSTTAATNCAVSLATQTSETLRTSRFSVSSRDIFEYLDSKRCLYVQRRPSSASFAFDCLYASFLSSSIRLNANSSRCSCSKSMTFMWSS